MTLNRFIILVALIIPTISATAQSYNNIEFIENKGQWDNRVKFKGEVSSGAFFIRSGGFTVLQHDSKDLQNVYDMVHGHNSAGAFVSRARSIQLKSHAYNVDFMGASADMQVVPDKPLPTYNNYIIGSDPSKWGGKCRIFQAITLKDVYHNVDVRYYTNNGVLEYDLIIKPGADISKIALRYDGVEKLQVKNKELHVGTSIGELKESAPYSYQVDTKGQREVNCKYIIKNNIVRFEVKDYDPASTLIIDPTLIFCSFSGSTANNWGFTATYGPDGSMYGGGIVFDDGFPTLTGAFQETYQGGDVGFGAGFDIGLIKLSPDGSNRIYATYLGGVLGNEFPQSLIVDQQGQLIVAGRSSSTDYPLMPATNKVGDGGKFDIIVTKLNATGSGLIGSIKVGGKEDDGANITPYGGGANSLQQNYGDEARSEVNLDAAGNIYLASCTQSVADQSGNGGFPVVGGFQAKSGGLQDGVVLKFPPDLSSVLFSSYLGGNGDDAGYVISIDPANGNVYVGGGTASTNLPGPTAGTIGPANNSNANAPTIDGFVSIISSNGSAILKTTYLGTSGIDQVYGIQFDKNNFPYVMGQTTGKWPVVNAPYSVTDAKQFIAKLQPDLSAYVYSTVFGTPSATFPNISPVAFLVDRCDNVYVSGWGGLGNRAQRYQSTGTFGLPVTPDALQSTTDGDDFYFFVMKKDAASQLYGSFFGQVQGAYPDHVDGGTSRFDRNGVIYQAVCGNCGGGTSFPTTTGAWAETKPSSAYCSLTLIKIAFNLSGVAAGIQASINGVRGDTSGCVPLKVDFSDTVRNAQSYIWNFGDGSPSVATTNFTISHTYNTTGFFPVSLISIDSSSCNVRDTDYLDIRVGDLRATVNFNPVKLPPCDSFNYQFNNLSIAPPVRPFGPLSFVWDFGDGSPRITTDNAAVFHDYSGPGTYSVTLLLQDTSYCNSPDSMTIKLNVAANVQAQFTTPPTGCVPYDAVFTNTSLAGQTFEWDFGDGTTSNATSPTHTYPLAGTYNIRLVANDPNTCNLTDTTYFTITVANNPVANFSYGPNPPVENTPITFANLSSIDAVLFKWDFGDGDTLQTASKAPVDHLYNATGTFNVCLTAFNAAGCSDTACQPVQTLIKTLVAVPNAFTPQSGDINSVVMVRGFGIAKMKFIIWNRWGQKVFETENRLQGWDGKVRGTLQPMDVYAYTLDVEFFDGTKTTRTGDVTLIR